MQNFAYDIACSYAQITGIPFYWTFKTLFLLYLALPQTQGSSYLYTYHLQPFFHNHEAEIDSTLASVKTRAYAFLQARARMLWGHVLGAMGQQRPADLTREGTVSQDASMGTGAPPSMQDPLSGPAQLLGSLWRSYGPALVMGGAALLHQSTAQDAPFGMNTSAQRSATPPPAPAPTNRLGPDMRPTATRQSTLERRRQLEAELAALAAAEADESSAPPRPTPTQPARQGYDVSPQSTPPASGGYWSPSPSASTSSLRGRGGRGSTDSAGRFEEVEVPSDIENEQGSAPGGSDPAQRTNWFGWGGPQAKGYDRIKND